MVGAASSIDIDAENNWEPFIGNGQRCLPGELDNCGDGGKARNARLSYPKGNTLVIMTLLII